MKTMTVDSGTGGVIRFLSALNMMIKGADRVVAVMGRVSDLVSLIDGYYCCLLVSYFLLSGALDSSALHLYNSIISLASLITIILIFYTSPF